MSQFKRFINDESGATAVEYGLIAALMAAALIAAMGTLTDGISTAFTDIKDCLTTPASC